MAKYENYKARGIKFEMAESRTKGTPYISAVFVVIDEAGKPRLDGGGDKISFEYQGYLTEKTIANVCKQLRTAGCTFPANDVTNGAGFGSTVVEIQVEDTDYGKRIAWVNDFKTSSVDEWNRMAPAAKKSFAAMFASAVAGSKIVGGAASPRVAAPVSTWVPPVVNADRSGGPESLNEDEETPEQIGAANDDPSYLSESESVAASGESAAPFTLF